MPRFKVQGFSFAICAWTSSPDTWELFLQGSPSQQRYKHTIIIIIIIKENKRKIYKKHCTKTHCT